MRISLWKIYPFLLKVESKKKVEFDYEHSKFKWLSLEELKDHDTMGRLKALKALDII